MYEELVKSLRAQADYYCCHMGINSPPAMMFVEAADAIEDLSKTLDEEVEINTALGCNMPVWIPVTERLPEDHIPVLICNDDGKIMTAERYENEWWLYYCPYDTAMWYEEENGAVTHWMPLPEPPKGGEEQ